MSPTESKLKSKTQEFQIPEVSLTKTSSVKKESMRISSWKKQQILETNLNEKEKDSQKNAVNFDNKLSNMPSPINSTLESRNSPMEKPKNFKIREKAKFKSMTTQDMKNIKNSLATSMSFKQAEQNYFIKKDKSMLPPINFRASPKSQFSHEIKNSFFTKGTSPSESRKFSQSKTMDLKTIINLNRPRNKISEFNHQPYITEVIEESKTKPHLRDLYPPSLHYIKESEVDRKAKDTAFSIEKILESDYYALYIAEILSIIIKNAIENYMNYNLKKKMEYVQKDYISFFSALFNPEEGRFLELLMEVMSLKKIKIEFL